MIMIRTDFSNEIDFMLAPEGEQFVVVEDVYPRKASTGKDMVVFEFRAKNGGKLFHNCMNEENNRWMLKKTLEAITGRIQPKGPVSFDSDDLKGQKLKVNVYYDEWHGQVRAKVEDVILGEQISPGQMDIEDFAEDTPF